MKTSPGSLGEFDVDSRQSPSILPKSRLDWRMVETNPEFPRRPSALVSKKSDE
jgi:hypothetical protein